TGRSSYTATRSTGWRKTESSSASTRFPSGRPTANHSWRRSTGDDPFVDGTILFVKTDKDHLFHRYGRKMFHCIHRNFGRPLFWKPIYSCADVGKGYRF